MAILTALCVADFGNVFARPSARACRAPPCYGRNRPPMRPRKLNLQKCMRSAAVPAHAIFVNTRVSETLTADLESRERERDAHAVRIPMCCPGAERRYFTLCDSDTGTGPKFAHSAIGGCRECGDISTKVCGILLRRGAHFGARMIKAVVVGTPPLRLGTEMAPATRTRLYCYFAHSAIGG